MRTDRAADWQPSQPDCKTLPSLNLIGGHGLRIEPSWLDFVRFIADWVLGLDRTGELVLVA